MWDKSLKKKQVETVNMKTIRVEIKKKKEEIR